MAVSRVILFMPGYELPWLRSPGRAFLRGRRLHEVPVVIVRICRRRIRIRVRLGGGERLVSVDPENILASDEAGRN